MIEKFRIAFTANGEREIRSLFVHKNQFKGVFRHAEFPGDINE